MPPEQSTHLRAHTFTHSVREIMYCLHKACITSQLLSYQFSSSESILCRAVLWLDYILSIQQPHPQKILLEIIIIVKKGIALLTLSPPVMKLVAEAERKVLWSYHQGKAKVFFFCMRLILSRAVTIGWLLSLSSPNCSGDKERVLEYFHDPIGNASKSDLSGVPSLRMNLHQ